VGSLGLGLPGSRRLVDEFTIDSAPGRGTTVVINQWER
jgi:serine/threonine-protein kinase RsbT